MIRKDIQVLVNNRQAHLASLGLPSHETSEWASNWRNLKGRAKRYGRACTLTFEQYTALAAEAGLKSATQVGAYPGAFQLGRHKDEGDYVPGNCRFIVKEENLKERWLYGRYRKQ
jgi:hypothetical protein